MTGGTELTARHVPNHAVLPVIHVEGADQACRNAERAMAAGADGVFLINHVGSAERLLEVAGCVHEAYPRLWIGVNALGTAARELFDRLPVYVRAVWEDNAGIDERQPAVAQPAAAATRAAQEASGWSGSYFGGVAFKYQREATDVTAAARAARGHLDVLTTSGPATGQPPDEGKLAALREGAGTMPIAVASGVTVGNVHRMLPHVGAFLVATGISSSWTDLSWTSR